MRETVKHIQKEGLSVIAIGKVTGTGRGMVLLSGDVQEERMECKVFEYFE